MLFSDDLIGLSGSGPAGKERLVRCHAADIQAGGDGSPPDGQWTATIALSPCALAARSRPAKMRRYGFPIQMACKAGECDSTGQSEQTESVRSAR